VGRPKTSVLTTISVKVPQDLLDRVQAYAQQQQQSVSALIREGLEWRLAQTVPVDDATADGLGQALVERFGDGKWHRVQTIAETMDADLPTVRALLDRIVAEGLYQAYAERRPSAHGLASYRIVKGGSKTINLTAFYAETKPILDEMHQLIAGHHVNFSQEVMGVLFAQLRQKIEHMAL